MIVNLDVTEDNTRLFEESDHYMTAVEFYFDSNRTYDVRLFFAESKRFLEGAEILESRGHASDAAIFYEMSGDLEGAIRSHEASGNHVAAGDLCFKIKDFSRALIVYSKSPVPPKKKIARTHERLGDWPEALKIYQELGDRKGCKRCGAKIAKQEARRLNRELPFLKASLGSEEYALMAEAGMSFRQILASLLLRSGARPRRPLASRFASTFPPLLPVHDRQVGTPHENELSRLLEE